MQGPFLEPPDLEILRFALVFPGFAHNFLDDGGQLAEVFVPNPGKSIDARTFTLRTAANQLPRSSA